MRKDLSSAVGRDRRVAAGLHPPVRRRAGAQPARLGPPAAGALGRHHPGDHRQLGGRAHHRRRVRPDAGPRRRTRPPTRSAPSGWRVLRFALLLTVLVTPVLAAAYAAGSADRRGVPRARRHGRGDAGPRRAGQHAVRGVRRPRRSGGADRGPGDALAGARRAPAGVARTHRSWLVAVDAARLGRRSAARVLLCRPTAARARRPATEHRTTSRPHGLVAQATSQG